MLGLDGVGVFLPVLGRDVDPGFGDAFTLSILGGSSSSSSTATADRALSFPSSLFPVLRSLRVVAEGGRETGFDGVVLVFFLENQPDFFCFSSSLTTMRSSVNSGSYTETKLMAVRHKRRRRPTSGSSK